MSSGGVMNEEEFLQSLRDKNYVVTIIERDNNSLFRAIAEDRLDGENSYEEARLDIRDCIKKLRDTDKYKSYFGDKSNDDIDQEIADIAKDGSLGGHLALMGACDQYERNITIHVQNGFTMFYPNVPIFNNTMHLAYLPETGHYNLLQAPENPPEAEEEVEDEIPPEANEEMDEENPSEADEEMEDETLAESGEEMSDETPPESEDEIGDEDNQNQAQVNIEDEDNFTKDYPDLNIVGNPPSQDLMSLLNSFTFKFLGKKFFESTRKSLDLFILVPKASCLDTLAATLRVLRGKKIYLLLDYGGRSSITTDLLRDEDAEPEFQVFRKRIEMPADRLMHTRSVFLSYALVVPLLLSAMRYTWNDVRVVTLCKKSQGALATHLLTYYWSAMRYQINLDLEAILESPEALFCETCPNTCIWRDEIWHHDLDDFVKVDFVEPTTSGFMEKYNLFRCVFPVKSEVMKDLRKVYFSNDARPFATLIYYLDLTAMRHVSDMFSSYLVLVMDGPNMHNYGDLTIAELFEKPDVYKMLYAGCCFGERFRKTHFDGNSAIYDVLTKNSVMYFVRQKFYKSRDAARTDEAIVIELLKTIVQRHRQERTAEFYLLNKCSSPQFLNRLSATYMDFMTKFCDSRVPVMRVNEDDDAVFPDRFFTGNYLVDLPVPMQPGAYDQREFGDVRAIYEQLIFRR